MNSGEEFLGVHFTEERALLVETARRFSLDVVLPSANELDPIKGDIPISLRNSMSEMGFFGLLIPEAYGGVGLGAFEYVLVTEELSRSWMSVASLLARGNGFGHAYSDVQRAAYLPRMARGEFLGAMAMSEADAGSDLSAMKCRAERAEGGWTISGTKMWCTFADGADFIIVAARTSPGTSERRHHGISLFLVEKARGELPAAVQGQPIKKIGYHGWKTWELRFNELFVPQTALLGEEGRGFHVLMNVLDLARVHTAARAVGLARGALEDSIEYAQQREQFGGPIAQFQAIRFRLAEMATKVEAARQLTYLAASKLDLGQKCGREASMAKLFASEVAEWVTSEGMQIHGGAGYTTDFALERYWRDARLTRIFEGTSEIQMRVISDSLLNIPELRTNDGR
jgi:alkylation response protein AidB-like acyl-CoA dehydrogenase